MKKPKTKQNRLYPIPRLTPQSKSLPATQGMLHLFRSELKADISELRSELKSDIKQLDAKISQVDAKVSQVEAKVSQVEAKVSQVEAKVEDVMKAVHHVAAEVARVGILVEEQNSKNSLVIEGYTGLAQRQDRLEMRIDGVEKLVQSVAHSRN
ncbi:MAG: hypothetical protein AAB116_27135 [Candidatus Poribacteria bacterium]